jgi:hypothetical protein
MAMRRLTRTANGTQEPGTRGHAPPHLAGSAHHVRVCSTTVACGAAPHERISHIGGVNPDGTRWLLRQSDAIAAIKQGSWRFYVENRRGQRAGVVVATHLGREYLKTEADGLQPDGLVSLVDGGAR